MVLDTMKQNIQQKMVGITFLHFIFILIICLIMVTISSSTIHAINQRTKCGDDSDDCQQTKWTATLTKSFWGVGIGIGAILLLAILIPFGAKLAGKDIIPMVTESSPTILITIFIASLVLIIYSSFIVKAVNTGKHSGISLIINWIILGLSLIFMIGSGYQYNQNASMATKSQQRYDVLNNEDGVELKSL